MMKLEQLQKIAKGKFPVANAKSVLIALELHGEKFGLDQMHRQVHFFAQILHESGGFKWDREIWGPTPAQKRYDTRTDLGNTPAVDGDGKKYMGHTAMQITGKANTREFRDWCRKFDKNCPDFVKSPELMNTDPWEGLGPIWYWDSRKLNQYADQNDIETLTKRINGGLNGFEDRIEYYIRTALTVLGFGHSEEEVKKFQKAAKLEHVDGDAGPKTRAALHTWLVGFTAKKEQSAKVAPGPVVEKEVVAVAPKQLDKPVEQTTGFWERIVGLFGAGTTGLLTTLGGVDWRWIAAIALAMIVVTSFGLLFHNRIINAVRELKKEAST